MFVRQGLVLAGCGIGCGLLMALARDPVAQVVAFPCQSGGSGYVSAGVHRVVRRSLAGQLHSVEANGSRESGRRIAGGIRNMSTGQAGG